MVDKSFAICINNSNYEASLERWKVHEVVKDEKAEALDQIRAIDESGEGYLFPHEFSVATELPKSVQEAKIADKSA